MRYRDFLKSVIALWTRPIRRYALLVFFRPALWRYGVLFSRKRYGVMGALKKALWRHEGSPPLRTLAKYIKSKVKETFGY